jgi:hypothetical protein
LSPPFSVVKTYHGGTEITKSHGDNNYRYQFKI